MTQCGIQLLLVALGVGVLWICASPTPDGELSTDPWRFELRCTAAGGQQVSRVCGLPEGGYRAVGEPGEVYKYQNGVRKLYFFEMLVWEDAMGIFSGISKKIADMRQRSKDKKEFFSSLLKAAEDGKLTDTEIAQIQGRYKELELTHEDLKWIRAQAYNAALHAAKSDGIVSAEEEAELVKLQQFLKVPDAEIRNSKKELARLRLLTEIQNGNLPSISVPNVLFQKAEQAYWSEPASILEERVVSRRYQGGSQGISLRIAKGVSYRVGSHRGHLVADKAVVPVSSGELIITNRRIIFRGDAKSFNFRLDKLLELEFFRDGVRLTDDKGKPRILKFSEADNVDVVGATLSYAVNQFVK